MRSQCGSANRSRNASKRHLAQETKVNKKKVPEEIRKTKSYVGVHPPLGIDVPANPHAGFVEELGA